MDYSENVMMAKVDKSNTKGMGIASMVLGVVSLSIFCSCCNIVLSVLALIFGFVQICTKTNKEGKVFAWVGIGTGIAAVICTIAFWAMCFSDGSVYTRMYNYNDGGSDEFMEEYYDFLKEFYNINPDMEEFYERYYQNVPGQNDLNDKYNQDKQNFDNTL